MQGSDNAAITDDRGRWGKERAWGAHMAGLQASYQRHIGQHPARKDARIEALLDPDRVSGSDHLPDWEIPNEIEILLVPLILGPDLDVALDSAFLAAERIGVPTWSMLARRRDGMQTDPAKQALLAKLLRDTHDRYAARRLERAERAVVAKRLSRVGLSLLLMVGVAMVALGAGLRVSLPDRAMADLGFHLLSRFNMGVAVFFRLLGAYLSRLIAFQNSAAGLSLDDLENGYAPNIIFVRLLVGSLSALVVYFLIAGRLIGGDLFPAPGSGDASGFGQLWATYDRRHALWNPHGQSYTGPTANFAKLIIWCFIAGFSERFLPDSLTSLETKSRS